MSLFRLKWNIRKQLRNLDRTICKAGSSESSQVQLEGMRDFWKNLLNDVLVAIEDEKFTGPNSITNSQLNFRYISLAQAM